MAHLPTTKKDMYESDFRLADEALRGGRVAQTTKDREKQWGNWESYCRPMGVDPYLDPRTTRFKKKIRTLTGFAARTRTGYYGRGRQVAVGTVKPALTAVGQKIEMDSGTNPVKLAGSTDLLLPLQLMIKGWGKKDASTKKKLPVEADVPEYMAALGALEDATELEKRVGDLALVAFYYLLRVGEYAVTGTKSNEKQTTQFKVSDVAFFARNAMGQLRQLPRKASDKALLAAAGATLRLRDQKNGWKNVCIHQQHNGNKYHYPVRALARIIINIRSFTNDADTFLSTYRDKKAKNVTDKEMRKGIKMAASVLEYPANKGINVSQINTHSFRAGGANALHMAGYLDRQIQKMGRWRSDTFKEYISDSLSTFSDGMSTAMKQKFNFVNIAGGSLTDVTTKAVATQYTAHASAA